MPTGMLTQVTLPSVTALSRDNVVNTFATSLVSPDLNAALAGIAAFYNQQFNGVSISTFLSNAISRVEDVVVKFYDLSDPVPPGREPIGEGTFQLNQLGSANSLPLEVAVVLSLRAGTAPGNLDRRRRGRVFLGPWSTDAVGSTVAGMPVVEPDLVNTILDAGSALYDATGGTWGVWSRLDDVVRGMSEISVNNEFDTQRRRGRDATQRVVVNLPSLP